MPLAAETGDMNAGEENAAMAETLRAAREEDETTGMVLTSCTPAVHAADDSVMDVRTRLAFLAITLVRRRASPLARSCSSCSGVLLSRCADATRASQACDDSGVVVGILCRRVLLAFGSRPAVRNAESSKAPCWCPLPGVCVVFLYL